MGRWLVSALAMGLAVSAHAAPDNAAMPAAPPAIAPPALAPAGLSPARLVDLRRNELAGCGTGSLEMAACRIALGEALLIERVYPEALTVLAAATAGLAGDTSKPATMLLALGQSALGEALARSSRYSDAKAELDKALAVLAAPADRARAQVRLARVLSFMARLKEAEQALQQARASAALAGTEWDTDDAARLLLSAAYNANLDDRWADGERDATASVQLIEAQHGPLDARLSDGLSLLSSALSMHAGALSAEATNERRLRVEQSRERPNPMTLGSVLNDLANNYDETNRPALSLPLRAQALAMTEAVRPGPSRELVIRLFNYGNSYTVLGRYAEAVPLLRRAYAVSITVFGKDHPTTTISMVELADALGQLGQRDESLQLLEQSVQIREKDRGADDRLTLAARRMLGTQLLAAGKTSEARTILTDVVAKSERSQGADAADTVLARISLAEVLVGSGDPAAARIHAQEALRALERSPLEDFMGLRRPPGSAGAALEMYGRSLTRLLLVQFQIGQRDPTIAAEAFATLQRLDAERQGTASSWRAAERLSTSDAAVRTLVDTQRAAQSRIAAARARQGEAVRAGDTATALAALETVAAERRAISGLVDQLSARLPEFAQLSGGVQTALPALNSGAAPVLGSGEALISFSQAKDVLLALVITRRGTAMVQLPGTSAAALTAQIKALRGSLDLSQAVTATELPAFDVAASHTLHALVMQPLMGQLKGIDTLFVASDGSLASLPLALLVTRASDAADPSTRYRHSRWLGDRFALVTLPSVNALVAFRKLTRPSAAQLPLLALADPAVRGTIDVRTLAALASLRGPATGESIAQRTATALCQMQPLPDTRREALALGRQLGFSPGSMLLGQAASETGLRALQADGTLRQYRTLLFATHGLSAGADATEEPALVLSPPPDCKAAADTEDGLLTASEITTFALDADLVVLSGCNTAGGLETISARPLSGLAAAFQYAGARRLLVSHWSVDSAATADLMGRIFATAGPITAMRLQQSMRQMRNSTGLLAYRAHPAFWAPFVLVGDR